MARPTAPRYLDPPMRMPPLLMALLVVLLDLSRAAAQPRPDALTRPWLEAFLTALSHDSLEGRATFTPGIERAARLIEREFARAGLRPLTSFGDSAHPYRQTYQMYRPARGRVIGRFNGQALSSTQAFGVGPDELTSLTTRSAGRINVVRARSGEPLLAR